MPRSSQAGVQCLHLVFTLPCTLHFNMHWLVPASSLSASPLPASVITKLHHIAVHDSDNA